MMTEIELLTYIKNRKYLCPFCIKLQTRVQKLGLIAIDEYEGLICSSVEDMKIRRWEIISGKKWEPIDPWEFL
jgi:hypothetical protein